MRKEANKRKLPFGTKGIERTALAVFIALIMTTTIFVPVIGTGEGTETLNTYIVYGEVNDSFGLPVVFANITAVNMNTGAVMNSTVEDGTYSMDLAEMKNGVHIGDKIEITFADGICVNTYNFTVDDSGEKILDVQLDPVDNGIPQLPDVNPLPPELPGLPDTGIIGEENATSVYINTSDYNITNSDNESSENSPIIMSDMGAYPLEMPRLTDTHLSPRDLRHWRDLFPKFMAFEDKKNMVYVELKNVGNESYIVKLDLYGINPDGDKTLLGTEHYGNIKPDREKTRLEIWVPAMAGRNYVYGEIYVMEVSGGFCHPNVNWTLINTFKKSFNVVPGDRPVRIITGDWVIEEPTIIESETVIVNGDMYVNANLEIKNTSVLGDDLIVNATSYTIDAGSNHDMQSWNYSGEYKVEVTPTGTLNVYGKLWNHPNDIYYNFYMNGSLTVDKKLGAAEAGSISEVNGDPSDLSAKGGIRCENANGSVVIRNGGMIHNTRSHALWLYNTSATLDGAHIYDVGGYGVYGIDSPVLVNNSRINNTKIGVYLKNCAGGGIDAWGKPDYTPGVDLGYFIWYDSEGWHLGISADGNTHTFNGSTNYSGTEHPFSLTIDNSAIINLGDPDNVTFDLWIDGVRQPTLVFIGEHNLNPESIPFTLTKNLTKIAGNIFERCSNAGIYLYQSFNYTVKDNSINGSFWGIRLSRSNHMFLFDNNMTNSGIFVSGNLLKHWNTHTISAENTVNNKPVYYWKNVDGGTIPSGAGEIILGNCTNVTADSQNVSDGTVGIELGFSSYNTLSNITSSSNHWAGIYLYHSTNNPVEHSNVSSNGRNVLLSYSSYNTIENSTFYDAKGYGNVYGSIQLYHSSNNNIVNNTVVKTGVAFGCGIYLRYSSHNMLAKNTVLHTDYGILLWDSSSNTIYRNNASLNNDVGILAQYDSHKNIIEENIANNNGYGIYLYWIHVYYYETDNRIINNTANSNSNSGIMVYNSQYTSIEGNTVKWNGYSNSDYGGRGIELCGAKNNNIINNNVSNNIQGIFLDSYSVWSYKFWNIYNTVSYNNISGNTYGIYLWSNSNSKNTQNIISTNNISENTYGIWLGDRAVNNEFSGNSISSEITDSIGIYHDSSYFNTLTSNNIRIPNGTGIYVNRGNPEISSNRIWESKWGIYSSISANPEILNNSIWNCESGSYIEGSSSIHENEVWNSTYGIYTSSTSNPEIYLNTIWNSNYGMYLEGMPWVHENNVWNCTYGIYTTDMPATDTTRTRLENSVDGVESETLTFSSAGNKVVHFSIPKNSKIISTSFNISGDKVSKSGYFHYQGQYSQYGTKGKDIKGDEWTAKENGVLSCTKAYIGTSGPTPTNSRSSSITYIASIYENGDHIATSEKVNSDGNNKWEVFHFNNVKITKGNKYYIEITSTDNFTWYKNSNERFAEIDCGTFVYYPLNSKIDMGSDGDFEWQYNGELKTTVSLGDYNTTPELSTEIQRYIDNNIPDSQGNVNIPMKIHSDSAGKLTIFNINIEYNPPVLVENNELYGNEYGIFSDTDTEATFLNNVAHNNSYGIYAENYPPIIGNDFFNNTKLGMYLYEFYGNASYNTVYNNEYGIYVKNSTGILENNEIYGHKHIGYAEGAGGYEYAYYYGYGIYCSNSSAEIIKNNLYNNSVGIHMNNSENASIESNRITERHIKGIIATYSKNISMDSNYINRAKFAIEMGNVENSSISKNTIQHTIWLGISGVECYNTSLSNNTLSNSYPYSGGINLYSSENSIIRDNLFDNDIGISLRSGSRYNIVIKNRISASEWGGIEIVDSNNNTIEENTVCSANTQQIVYAISSIRSENNIITGNELNNASIGIYISDSFKEIIERNIIENMVEPSKLSDYSGIYIIESDEIEIKNNHIDNCIFGINIEKSAVEIEENAIENNKLSGIVASVVPSPAEKTIIIKNNSIYGNGYDTSLISSLKSRYPEIYAKYPLNSGIEIWSGNATILNNTITNNYGDGILITGDDTRGYFRPYIASNNISGNAEWGIEARYEAPLNNQTINEDNTWVVNNTDGRFVQEWFIRVHVTLNGNDVSGATVWIEDVTGTEVWRGNTDENGLTPCITVIEYYINNTGEMHTRTPHVIHASYEDNYYGVLTERINRNMPEIEVQISQ